MKEENLLEGMPPAKKPRKRVVKKFHTTKNIPVEVAVRRQVAEEIGDGEPTKDEKFILLQKYGVASPRIDRLMTKPNFMGVAEWKRKLNDWIKATKGRVRPQQRPRTFQSPNSQPQHPSPQKWSQRSKDHQRGTKTFHRNYTPVPTANRPN